MQNDRNDTENSWFVAAMVKATSDMWDKGWDERNGGNVSLRLMPEDVAPYKNQWTGTRLRPLGNPLPGLAGQYFLVTGSGKYFRNVQIEPAGNLCVIRVSDDGANAEIVWGLKEDEVPTSELSTHLKTHLVRQKKFGDRQRVVMHCHATNLIALSYVLKFETANLTRALWEGSTECLVVFPEGVAALDWMVPGTEEIGDASAAQMDRFPLMIWQYHGVFGCGSSLDETFGLIDTAEKSAEVLVKVIAMGGVRQTMTHDQLIALAKRFEVIPYAPAMALDGWALAGR